jgi:hypothetical protein
MVHTKFEIIWKEDTAAYPGPCLGGLQKSTHNLTLDSQFMNGDLNPVPPECEEEVLTF